MNRLVQWGVVLGVLWCLFVCVIGNWATGSFGRVDHGRCYAPEFWACVVALAAVHTAAAWQFFNREVGP